MAAVTFAAHAAEKKATSYSPVDITTPFADTMAKMKADKAAVMQKHETLLQERYDLKNAPAQGVTMTRGKAVQEGVRAKLPQGMTWEKLAAMSPAEIKAQGVFPKGFLPLPHPNHPEGGMVFPKFHIDEIKKQTGRDLTRFDLDFDLPDHFLAEFPPSIFLNTRPDLGDVSKGKVVTTDNYFEIFDGILNPKQLEGLRLLVTPFPQQQFNATDDRRSERPSLGVTCFDCH
ncbi:MAG: cytochrome B6, partial [Burkholderiales bacterium]